MQYRLFDRFLRAHRRVRVCWGCGRGRRDRILEAAAAEGAARGDSREAGEEEAGEEKFGSRLGVEGLVVAWGSREGGLLVGGGGGGVGGGGGHGERVL